MDWTGDVWGFKKFWKLQILPGVQIKMPTACDGDQRLSSVFTLSALLFLFFLIRCWPVCAKWVLLMFLTVSPLSYLHSCEQRFMMSGELTMQGLSLLCPLCSLWKIVVLLRFSMGLAKCALGVCFVIFILIITIIIIIIFCFAVSF